MIEVEQHPTLYDVTSKESNEKLKRSIGLRFAKWFRELESNK